MRVGMKKVVVLGLKWGVHCCSDGIWLGVTLSVRMNVRLSVYVAGERRKNVPSDASP